VLLACQRVSIALVNIAEPPRWLTPAGGDHRIPRRSTCLKFGLTQVCCHGRFRAKDAGLFVLRVQAMVFMLFGWSTVSRIVLPSPASPCRKFRQSSPGLQPAGDGVIRVRHLHLELLVVVKGELRSAMPTTSDHRGNWA